MPNIINRKLATASSALQTSLSAALIATVVAVGATAIMILGQIKAADPLAIAAGNVPGYSHVNKFGNTSNADEGVLTDVWDASFDMVLIDN